MTEESQVVVESNNGPVIDIDKPIVLVEARQKIYYISRKDQHNQNAISILNLNFINLE